MKLTTCPQCGTEVSELVYRFDQAADPIVLDIMQGRFPGWRPEQGACKPCVDQLRRFTS